MEVTNYVPYHSKYGFSVFTQSHELWLNILTREFSHVLKSGRIESSEIASIRDTMKSLSRDSSIQGVVAVSAQSNPSVFQTDPNLKVTRGVYLVPDLTAIRTMFNYTGEHKEINVDETSNNYVSVEDHVKNLQRELEVNDEQTNHIPSQMMEFHETKSFKEISRVISMGIYYPLYLHGDTGTGKTTEVVEACARLGRGLVRVNITTDTDEMDLMGGIVLRPQDEGGGTAFEYGPVVEAMRTGSVLLLDELDLGTPKIMCLQPVLEGKPVYLKLAKEWVYPKEGFTVIATANTKGRGAADHGNFVGAQYLNEAFMDRFPYWIEVTHPTPGEERKILTKYWKSISTYNIPKSLIADLVSWGNEIREGFSRSDFDSSMSTRRLKDYLTHANMFFERTYTDVMHDMVRRYDSETSEAFSRLWNVKFPNYDKMSIQKSITGENDQVKKTEKKEKTGSNTWNNPNNS